MTSCAAPSSMVAALPPFRRPGSRTGSIARGEGRASSSGPRPSRSRTSARAARTVSRSPSPRPTPSQSSSRRCPGTPASRPTSRSSSRTSMSPRSTWRGSREASGSLPAPSTSIIPSTRSGRSGAQVVGPTSTVPRHPRPRQAGEVQPLRLPLVPQRRVLPPRLRLSDPDRGLGRREELRGERDRDPDPRAWRGGRRIRAHQGVLGDRHPRRRPLVLHHPQ